jgi:hypothetical protein
VEALFVAVLVYGSAVFALFWILRLGVRYGVDDVLRKNRDWLKPEVVSSRDSE